MIQQVVTITIERELKAYLIWVQAELVRRIQISHGISAGPYRRAIADAQMLADGIGTLDIEVWCDMPASCDLMSSEHRIRLYPESVSTADSLTVDEAARLTYHQHRCQALAEIPTHPWLGRVWARLSERDIIDLSQVLADHHAMEYGELDTLVQRMYVDWPHKPKRWREISEILTCLNSSARARHHGGGRIVHKR